jgi:hypothetical protein
MKRVWIISNDGREFGRREDALAAARNRSIENPTELVSVYADGDIEAGEFDCAFRNGVMEI